MIAVADQPLSLSVGEASGEAGGERHVVPDPEAEYRLRPADETGLRAIAAATGGLFNPRPADLSGVGRLAPASRHAVWPWLVLVGLGLWMVDLVLRRVRLFEPAI